jgi:electron transfer flavoprotein alpha subunit
MERILFLSNATPGGGLDRAGLEGLTAAKAIADGLAGSVFLAGVFGETVGSAAHEAAGAGAERVYTVEGAAFAPSRYETDALAAEGLCKHSQATMVVLPGTSRLSRIAAGVAYRIGARIDSHITELRCVEESSLHLTRWYYRQRMRAVITRTQRPWIAVVDPGSFRKWDGSNGAPALQPIEISVSDADIRTTVSGVQQPPGAEQTIRPDADLLFVAGAGWTKSQKDGANRAAEAEAIILEFLRRSQASLGGSKSMVDQTAEGQHVLSFMTHLNQIGQTGASPRHPKGLATCCHGEEPHAVGWRFINERRAINLDASCGWAQGKADVLYVADAFSVIAKVNEILARD